MLTRRDLFWGYASQTLNIGVGLAILPLVLHFLTPKEVALWFVFITIAGISQLLEMGFQPTISRNVAYLYAGAQKLSTHGLNAEATGQLNQRLLAALMVASQRVYLRIAMAAGLVLLLAGTAYIHTLLPAGEPVAPVLLAWGLFAASSVVNFYFGYIIGFLSGRGDQTQGNQVIVLSRLLQLVASALLLGLGWGLLGLAAASLLSTVASRVVAYRFLRSGPRSLRPDSSIAQSESSELISVLWHNSSRFGTVLIGAFLIGRANVLVASSTLGLVEAAGYALAVQLLVLLQSVASVPFSLSVPRMNSLRATGDQSGLYGCFSRAIAFSLLVALLAALTLNVLGPLSLKLISSGTTLPPPGLLLLMSVACVLEVNHGNCGNFLATSNTITFVRPAIVTGTLIVMLSVGLISFFGIAALVFSNFICQVVYNNWKWPSEAAKHFQVGFFSVLWDGCLLMARDLQRMLGLKTP